ncbi:MAG: hypothetical protein LBO79_07470 [Zoogloeaceae bacterium]|jgi:hypothetical protein|nr:hypothetical protein [Zoogloeaceae bacterium]
MKPFFPQFLVLCSIFLAADVPARETDEDGIPSHWQAKAERGDPAATAILARILLHRSDEHDAQAGLAWLQRAVAAQDPLAIEMEAILFEEGGLGYPKNPEQMVARYRQALAAAEALIGKALPCHARRESRTDSAECPFYPLTYLLAQKTRLREKLGQFVAAGTGTRQDLREAVHLFAANPARLGDLAIRHPELEFPGESLEKLAIGLRLLGEDEGYAQQERELAFMRLGRLYEDEKTGPVLLGDTPVSGEGKPRRSPQRTRWITALTYYANAGETGKTAHAALEKKLQAWKIAPDLPDSSATGSYSGENMKLALFDNGRFHYAMAFGIAGRGISFSSQGQWTTGRRRGQVCLALPRPELLLFGGSDSEPAADPLAHSIQVRIVIPHEFQGHILFSGDDMAFPNHFLRITQDGISLEPDTRTLFLAFPADKSSRKTHVYRYTLNPEYNTYLLTLGNEMAFAYHVSESGNDDTRPFPGVFRNAHRAGTKATEAICGELDTNRLERSPISEEAQVHYGNLLEENEKLPMRAEEGEVYMRIPAQYLGLHTINQPRED